MPTIIERYEELRKEFPLYNDQAILLVAEQIDRAVNAIEKFTAVMTGNAAPFTREELAVLAELEKGYPYEILGGTESQEAFARLRKQAVIDRYRMEVPADEQPDTDNRKSQA
jgi:hypothetical protein